MGCFQSHYCDAILGGKGVEASDTVYEAVRLVQFLGELLFSDQIIEEILNCNIAYILMPETVCEASAVVLAHYLLVKNSITFYSIKVLFIRMRH